MEGGADIGGGVEFGEGIDWSLNAAGKHSLAANAKAAAAPLCQLHAFQLTLAWAITHKDSEKI